MSVQIPINFNTFDHIWRKFIIYKKIMQNKTKKQAFMQSDVKKHKAKHGIKTRASIVEYLHNEKESSW